MIIIFFILFSFVDILFDECIQLCLFFFQEISRMKDFCKYDYPTVLANRYRKISENEIYEIQILERTIIYIALTWMKEEKQKEKSSCERKRNEK